MSNAYAMKNVGFCAQRESLADLNPTAGLIRISQLTTSKIVDFYAH